MGGRRSDDESNPMLAYRMTALERRVDAGFRHMDDRLDTLAFVRTDVYLANETARDAAFKALEKNVLTEAAEAKRLGVWALGLFGSLVAMTVIGVLLAIAQVPS